MKHTEGPWQIVGNGYPRKSSNFDKAYRLPVSARGQSIKPGVPRGYVVVARAESLHAAECVANGRLIAAAPAMLSLLLDCLNALRDTAGGNDAWRSGLIQRGRDLLSQLEASDD